MNRKSILFISGIIREFYNLTFPEHFYNFTFSQHMHGSVFARIIEFHDYHLWQSETEEKQLFVVPLSE